MFRIRALKNIYTTQFKHSINNSLYTVSFSVGPVYLHFALSISVRNTYVKGPNFMVRKWQNQKSHPVRESSEWASFYNGLMQ
jgi:hypothetical protein